MRAKPCISNQLSGAAAAGGLRNTLGEPLCSTMLSPEGQLFLFYMSIYGTWFEKREFGEGDYVSVHYESTKHIQRALQQIRARGAKPMIALNPATPLEVLEWVLPDIDAVLLMTVNPGFAGQKLVPQTLEKITACRKYLDERGYDHVEIEVDGNVSFENARKMSDAGADIFVAGSSSMFKKELTLEEGIAQLREAIK